MVYAPSSAPTLSRSRAPSPARTLLGQDSDVLASFGRYGSCALFAAPDGRQFASCCDAAFEEGLTQVFGAEAATEAVGRGAGDGLEVEVHV